MEKHKVGEMVYMVGKIVDDEAGRKGQPSYRLRIVDDRGLFPVYVTLKEEGIVSLHNLPCQAGITAKKAMKSSRDVRYGLWSDSRQKWWSQHSPFAWSRKSRSAACQQLVNMLGEDGTTQYAVRIVGPDGWPIECD